MGMGKCKSSPCAHLCQCFRDQSPEDPVGRGHRVELEASSAPGPPGLHHPWGHTLGDMKSGVYGSGLSIPGVPPAPQSQGWAEPYLGPATDEQVQHILTDLVVVFIQKLVNLAKSKTSR